MEICLDGDRIVAASCTETRAPLRGHWRLWSFFDQSTATRISQSTIIAGLRDALRNQPKANNP